MKTPAMAGCAALLLLLLALCSPTSSAPGAFSTPVTCCVGHSGKFPRKLLDRYYDTSSTCSLPGVVFITKKGREICANPADQWVQDYMSHLDQN
ncbi:hypothetical protein lerEdw1_004792 [Lerista edwardsae]|nr:hypothetical protein lerEdw1_004792 [Lerista edwardsae]